MGKNLHRKQHFDRQFHVYGTVELGRAVDECAQQQALTASAWVRAAIVSALQAQGIAAPPLPADYATPKHSRMIHRIEDRVAA